MKTRTVYVCEACGKLQEVTTTEVELDSGKAQGWCDDCVNRYAQPCEDCGVMLAIDADGLHYGPLWCDTGYEKVVERSGSIAARLERIEEKLTMLLDELRNSL